MIDGLFTLIEIIAVVICIHNLYSRDKIFSMYTLIFVCLESFYIQLANEGIVSKEVMIVIYLLFILWVVTLLSSETSEISTTRYAGARCMLYKKITFPFIMRLFKPKL